MKQCIQKLVKKIEPELIAIRRHLHQYPELSYEEYETARFIQEKLHSFGIPFKSGIAGTGILGMIKGHHDGGVVALRADMDALPVHEENDHDFVSNGKTKCTPADTMRIWRCYSALGKFCKACVMNSTARFY